MTCSKETNYFDQILVVDFNIADACESSGEAKYQERFSFFRVLEATRYYFVNCFWGLSVGFNLQLVRSSAVEPLTDEFILPKVAQILCLYLNRQICLARILMILCISISKPIGLNTDQNWSYLIEKSGFFTRYVMLLDSSCILIIKK